MAAQHRTHRQLHDAAFLRRRFWVEVVLAVVVGALFGYVTGPFFLDWAGVSLVATENPDPVPATWSNTLLVSLGLFGGIIWPVLFLIPVFWLTWRRARRAEADRGIAASTARARREAEMQARIARAQAEGVLDQRKDTP